MATWLGARVSVETKLSGEEERHLVYGVVKYVGTVKFSAGDWVGIELDTEYAKYAKNDGSVQGVTYFNSSGDTAMGLFVKLSAVNLLAKDPGHSHLVDQLHSIKDKLEISEVERETLSQSNLELERQLADLKLTLKSIESFNGDSTKGIDSHKLLIELEEYKTSAELKESELKESITLLKEELSQVYNNLSLLNTQLDQTTNDLTKYQNQNNGLKEQLNSLQPESAIIIIEKLTQKISDYEFKIETTDTLINEYKKQEEESKSLELEFSSTFESLNLLITDLNEQLIAEIDKCSELKKKLHTSSELIKSLKMPKTTTPSFLSEDIYPFKGLQKLTEAKFCELMKDKSLSSGSVILLKKLININEIFKILGEHIEQDYDSSNWEDVLAISQVYINTLLRFGTLNIPLNNIDIFLESFWLLSEESNSVAFISELDKPYHWDDQLDSSADTEMINLMKLKYVTNNETLDAFTGIESNDYLNEIISNYSPKDIEINLTQMKFINPIEEKKQPFSSLPENNHNQQIDVLKHKINILESKLQDEQKLLIELTQLNTDLDSKETETVKLKTRLASIEKLQIETQINYKNAKSILRKFGIDSIKNEIINELQVIENMKLVDIIGTQREIISKITPKLHEFKDDNGGIDWLNEWPQDRIKTSLEYSKVVNTLIDLNILSTVDSSLLEQHMLNFLCN